MSDTYIIDYGMGNLRSVAHSLEILGADYNVSSKYNELKNAKAFILPGVGAFSQAVNNLKKLKLFDLLNHKVIDEEVPFLGICLGMQLTAKSSNEHGYSEGFGWVDGKVIKINSNGKNDIRVPHVGWNNLLYDENSVLFKNISNFPDFYFDHSFQLICDEKYVAATCEYGERITAAIQYNNIFATQFHPEKSQRNGLKLIRNFLNYTNENQ